ncbi:hypothetical protein [Desulfonema ishimotonii]|uniref:hypothetical protein n=1 Tax=Desulfonema ishimotonii TaxID=45657 RepID=UPI000F56E2CC|nr:hypothetical protein [Desulfonema ishimotonii]
MNADGLEATGAACLPLSETVDRWKDLTALALRHLASPPGWQGIINGPLISDSGLSDLRQLLGAYTVRGDNPFTSFSAEGWASGSMSGETGRLPQMVNTPVARNRESGDTPQAVKPVAPVSLRRQKASRISAKAKMTDSGNFLTDNSEKEREKTRPVRPHTRLSEAVRKWENAAQIPPRKMTGSI